MRVCCTLMLLSALLGDVAQGQRSAILLATGARVRVTAPALGPDPHIGRVVASGPDTIVVQTADRFVVPVPVDRITQLDVAVGRHPRKGMFALIGAVAGMAGIVDPKYNALAGATLGALIGAVVGQAWKTDRWEPLTR